MEVVTEVVSKTETAEARPGPLGFWVGEPGDCGWVELPGIRIRAKSPYGGR